MNNWSHVHTDDINKTYIQYYTRGISKCIYISVVYYFIQIFKTVHSKPGIKVMCSLNIKLEIQLELKGLLYIYGKERKCFI